MLKMTQRKIEYVIELVLAKEIYKRKISFSSKIKEVTGLVVPISRGG